MKNLWGEGNLAEEKYGLFVKNDTFDSIWEGIRQERRTGKVDPSSSKNCGEGGRMLSY